MPLSKTRFFPSFLTSEEFFSFPFVGTNAFSRSIRSKLFLFLTMTKQIFSTTDVAAEAACLRSRIIGYRVTNVYDAGASKVKTKRFDLSISCFVCALPSPVSLSHHTLPSLPLRPPTTSHNNNNNNNNQQGILLKLSRSGDDGEKAFLLLEPGSRFHLTSEPPERPDAPSGFALKLRKHLRSRRLEGLRQLGADRLVDLSFGSGKGCFLEWVRNWRERRSNGKKAQLSSLFSPKLKNSKTQKKLETSPHTTQETALTTSCSSFTRRATSA